MLAATPLRVSRENRAELAQRGSATGAERGADTIWSHFACRIGAGCAQACKRRSLLNFEFCCSGSSHDRRDSRKNGRAQH